MSTYALRRSCVVVWLAVYFGDSGIICRAWFLILPRFIVLRKVRYGVELLHMYFINYMISYWFPGLTWLHEWDLAWSRYYRRTRSIPSWVNFRYVITRVEGAGVGNNSSSRFGLMFRPTFRAWRCVAEDSINGQMEPSGINGQIEPSGADVSLSYSMSRRISILLGCHHRL